MDQKKTNEKMDRSINFFGLLAMGIGCMFGTSWLLLTAGWLDRAGGSWNVVLALILCLIVELPLAFAYLEVIPMFPEVNWCILIWHSENSAVLWQHGQGLL